MLRTCGFLALLFAFAFTLTISPQFTGNQAHAAEIVMTNAQSLSNIIQQGNKNCENNGKSCKNYNLFFVFASWCHYCSSKMPVILNLSRTYADNLNTYFISLDESVEELKHFAELLPKELKIFVLPSNQTADFFGRFNLNFRYNIPSFALIDKQNNIVINMVNSLNKIEAELKNKAKSS